MKLRCGLLLGLLQKFLERGQGIAQFVYCLALQAWEPEFSPQNLCEETPDTVAPTCNPGTGEVKTGKSVPGACWPVGLASWWVLGYERPWLNKQGWWYSKELHNWCCPLASAWMYPPTRMWSPSPKVTWFGFVAFLPLSTYPLSSSKCFKAWLYTRS